LETAGAMLASKRYLYVVFMCQQSIEKLVKGLFVMFCNQEPPRTHNIAHIFKRIIESIDKANQPEDFIRKSDQYNAFFVKLLAYYIAERYPSYKEKLSQAVDQQEATDVLALTEEVFVWLISLKQFAPV
jgi:HEPN domain-containing protein